MDYFIAPNQFLDKISKCVVGSYIPWLSDHCIIKTTFQTMNDYFRRKPRKEEEPPKIHPGFLWDDISKENFQTNLSSPYFKEKFNALSALDNLEPLDIA